MILSIHKAYTISGLSIHKVYTTMYLFKPVFTLGGVVFYVVTSLL